MKNIKRRFDFFYLKAFLVLLFLANIVFSSCRKEDDPIQPEYGVKAVNFKNIDNLNN